MGLWSSSLCLNRTRVSTGLYSALSSSSVMFCRAVQYYRERDMYFLYLIVGARCRMELGNLAKPFIWMFKVGLEGNIGVTGLNWEQKYHF